MLKFHYLQGLSNWFSFELFQLSSRIVGQILSMFLVYILHLDFSDWFRSVAEPLQPASTTTTTKKVVLNRKTAVVVPVASTTAPAAPTAAEAAPVDGGAEAAATNAGSSEKKVMIEPLTCIC